MTTYEEKQARLERGIPYVVHPREVKKAFKDTETCPEIILGCMLVSGVLDTSEIMITHIHLAHGISITEEQQRAYDNFRRVLDSPTEEEETLVFQHAWEIAATTSKKLKKPFHWYNPKGELTVG